ncbi:kinase-like domain-containing protein [Trichophaea hybrida]|nr:kinase-like domain-containing protein [Trichophaea hybrida]
MTPESLPELNTTIVPSLNPPLAPSCFGSMEHLGDHFSKANFLIGPPEFDLDCRECPTVLEEDEGNETSSELQEPVTPTSETNGVVHISSSCEGFHPHPHIATPKRRQTADTPISSTPMTGTSTPTEIGRGGMRSESPSGIGRGKLRRHASERIQTIIRRVNSSSNKNGDGLLVSSSSPTKASSPTKGRGFFLRRHTSSIRLQGHSPPLPASPTSSAELEPSTFVSRPSSLEDKPKRPTFFSRKNRSNSVNGIKDLAGTGITHPAVAGAGLKSRRMSIDVPHMDVPVVPLSSKYASHSHIPGKSKKCGEGVSAIVKVMHKLNGPRNELFAVKEFRKRARSETPEEYIEKVNSEYCVSKSLNHPNIVVTEDLCFSQNKQNLLISADGHLKITDFGVSEVFAGKHPGSAGIKCGMDMTEIRLSNPGIVGSAPYIAPEVQGKTGLYDARKLDVWSCAMIYMVIVFGGPLWYSTEVSPNNPHFAKYIECFKRWEERNPVADMKRDNSYPRHPVFASLKPSAMKLIYRMLHLDPSKRITVQEALSDKWIQSIEVCNVDGGRECGGSEIDAGCKAAAKQVVKAGIHRLHHHLPGIDAKPFGKGYD